MKSPLAKFAFFVFTAMNCCWAATNSNVTMGKVYRIEIPHFVVEFLIPPELKRGYGPFRTEIAFETPANPRFTFSFGDGTYRKEVGSLFLGVRGDFKDWDLEATIFVIKFDNNQRSVRSAEDVAAFARSILAEKYILANGKQVDDLGTVTIEKLGTYDVVVATRAEPFRRRSIKISGGDREVSRSPFQLYFVRLDDEIAIGVRVSHDNARKLSPEWYAESHGRVTKIIESLKVSPKPAEAGQTGSGR